MKEPTIAWWIVMMAFIAILIGYVVIMTILRIRHERRKSGSDLKNYLETNPKDRCLLIGEVIKIMHDKVTGLTLVQIKDDLGMTQSGISGVPVAELAERYAGMGHVEIPVIASTDGYGCHYVVSVLDRMKDEGEL